MIEIPKEVMAKLQKILTLANNEGATEGEVMAALGRARSMLQQYDLSLDEFSNILRDKSDTSVVEESIFETANTQNWVYVMLLGVATLTNTKMFYVTKGYNTKGKVVTKYMFLGSKTDIGIAAAISSYLYYAAKGFADIYTQHNPRLINASQKRIFRNNFYAGFSDRVRKYAIDIREEEKRKAQEEAAKQNNERALVVVWNSLIIQKENAISEFEEDRRVQLKLKKGAARKTGKFDGEGYQKGSETANTVLGNKPSGYVEDK